MIETCKHEQPAQPLKMVRPVLVDDERQHRFKCFLCDQFVTAQPDGSWRVIADQRKVW